MIAAIDPSVATIFGGIVVAGISGFVAYRQARIGAATDREARLAQIADKTIERQDERIDTLEVAMTEMRAKHEECLNREAQNMIKIRHLNDRVDELSSVGEKYEAQRKLKHDWRSFAGSLYMERETARRFLNDGRLEDAVRMMDETERLRSDSPLLDDLQDLIERDMPQ